MQLERFRREARTVARLSHPHVVTVIDAGEDDGHPFIVFEFVDGDTLKGLIKRTGPLPVVEAVAYAIEIGRGLMAAHARAARAPRREAAERADRPRRARQGHRLRHLALARLRRPDRDRPRARHDRLRRPGAGAGRGRDRAVATSTRSASASSRCSPDGAVHRREPGGRGDEARARAAAGRAGAAPRGVGGACGDRRARDLEGARATATPTPPRWSTTSSRRWGSRPRARARPTARRPRCSAPARGRRARSRRGGCAKRRPLWLGIAGAARRPPGRGRLPAAAPRAATAATGSAIAAGAPPRRGPCPARGGKDFDPPPAATASEHAAEGHRDRRHVDDAWTTEHVRGRRAAASRASGCT